VNLSFQQAALGLRGTVVVVHPQSGFVEVVFDKEFIGGSTLGGLCSNGRGALIPWSSVLCISKPQPKVAARPPPTSNSSAPAQQLPTQIQKPKGVASSSSKPVVASVNITKPTVVKAVTVAKPVVEVVASNAAPKKAPSQVLKKADPAGAPMPMEPNSSQLTPSVARMFQKASTASAPTNAAPVPVPVPVTPPQVVAVSVVKNSNDAPAASVNPTKVITVVSQKPKPVSSSGGEKKTTLLTPSAVLRKKA
jgi:5'-3' exoribonuclease 1